MAGDGKRLWPRRLWDGEIPLPEAFWWYLIGYGLVVNALATLAALAAITAGAPTWVAGVLYFLPLPYNLLVLVGVWRAADRWQGAPVWANAARLATVLWVLATTAL